MHSFADLFWAMIVFYFIFMILWIFIRIFVDIFHREDISGGMKVLWIFAIFIVPFFAAIVYMVTRPNTAAMPGSAAGQQASPVAATASVAATSPATATPSAATPSAATPSAATPSAAAPSAAAPSSADEIAKLAALRDSGAITPAEFDTLKARALA